MKGWPVLRPRCALMPSDYAHCCRQATEGSDVWQFLADAHLHHHWRNAPILLHRCGWVQSRYSFSVGATATIVLPELLVPLAWQPHRGAMLSLIYCRVPTSMTDPMESLRWDRVHCIEGCTSSHHYFVTRVRQRCRASAWRG